MASPCHFAEIAEVQGTHFGINLQMAEHYRRGIVLLSPALGTETPDGDQADEMMDYLPLPDPEFWGLWYSGIFQELNQACRIRIDDYEEEELPVTMNGKALEVVERRLARKGHDSERTFLLALRRLLLESIRVDRPLIFVF